MRRRRMTHEDRFWMAFNMGWLVVLNPLRPGRLTAVDDMVGWVERSRLSWKAGAPANPWAPR